MEEGRTASDAAALPLKPKSVSPENSGSTREDAVPHGGNQSRWIIQKIRELIAGGLGPIFGKQIHRHANTARFAQINFRYAEDERNARTRLTDGVGDIAHIEQIIGPDRQAISIWPTLSTEIISNVLRLV